MMLAASLPPNLPLEVAISAVRTLLLGGLVGLVLTAFRVKSTSAHLFAWTAVLYAALAMPALQWVLPPLPLSVPTFPTASLPQRTSGAMIHTVAAPAILASTSLSPTVTVAESRANVASPALHYSAGSTVSPSFWSAISSTAFVTAVYLAVACLLLARFLVGIAFSRRLMRGAPSITDSRLTNFLLSREPSRRTPARIAESHLISVPVTMGILRPAILLPADWRDWDSAKLHSVLAHELSHVARHDALTQRLSLLHRAIFWFSPLAWWLDRHIANLAEQASDEAALASGADRKHYARVLLGFFEGLHAAPARVWWQGVAMANSGQAERHAEQRVERILSFQGAQSMRMKKSVAAAILILAVPTIYLVASVRAADGQSAPPAQTQPQASPKPSPAIAPAPEPVPQAEPEVIAPGGPTDGIDGGVPAPPAMPAAPGPGVSGGVRGPAPIAPVAPAAPVAPVGPVAQVAPVAPAPHHGFTYRYGFDDDQRFVIVSGKTDSFTMSGNGEDARHVEKLRKSIPGDFIWFQRDEKSYVIRDQATIDRALKLWEPQKELGKKQQELGKQQEALGKQQEELGKKMRQVRVNVPDLTTELEKLKAELQELKPGATADQVGHIQSEIGRLQSKIGEVQSQAGDQQGRIGEEMGNLGEKQGELGRQQGELGRQQGELAREANQKMEQLLDDAVVKGLAQPEL